MENAKTRWLCALKPLAMIVDVKAPNNYDSDSSRMGDGEEKVGMELDKETILLVTIKEESAASDP